MIPQKINPFYAILVVTIVAGTGTLFLSQKIATTPLVYPVVPVHSFAAHFKAQLGNANYQASLKNR